MPNLGLNLSLFCLSLKKYWNYRSVPLCLAEINTILAKQTCAYIGYILNLVTFVLCPVLIQEVLNIPQVGVINKLGKSVHRAFSLPPALGCLRIGLEVFRLRPLYITAE